MRPTYKRPHKNQREKSRAKQRRTKNERDDNTVTGLTDSSADTPESSDSDDNVSVPVTKIETRVVTVSFMLLSRS